MASSRKCRRCAGTGYLPEYMHVLDGKCLACNGIGFVTILTAAEKSAAEAAYARRCNLIRVLGDRARELGHDTYYDAHAAWDHLETNVPDRFARLLDAVERECIDEAIACLRGYAAEHVYR